MSPCPLWSCGSCWRSVQRGKEQDPASRVPGTEGTLSGRGVASSDVLPPWNCIPMSPAAVRARPWKPGKFWSAMGIWGVPWQEPWDRRQPGAAPSGALEQDSLWFPEGGLGWRAGSSRLLVWQCGVPLPLGLRLLLCVMVARMSTLAGGRVGSPMRPVLGVLQLVGMPAPGV